MFEEGAKRAVIRTHKCGPLTAHKGSGTKMQTHVWTEIRAVWERRAKLWAEGDKLWAKAIIAAYGPETPMDWMDDGGFRLPDGTVLAPVKT